MNKIAVIGHNNPPSDLDLLRDEFDLNEVESWLDGEPVENDGQMKTVDHLLGQVKAAEKVAEERKEVEFRPHKQAADAVSARWKPTIEDLKRMRTGLISIVGDYKAKRAAEQEAERRRIAAEAERLRAEAEAAKRDADMGNIEQRREADEISLEARMKSKAASDVEKIKGMRKHTFPVVTDYQKCVNWIAKNDKDALRAFCDSYAKTAQREGRISEVDGAELKTEMRAV